MDYQELTLAYLMPGFLTPTKPSCSEHAPQTINSSILFIYISYPPP